MERTNCVICDESNFIDNFNLLNTINIVSSNYDIEEDEIKTLNFVSCDNCGCVQLKNLFLKSEIYSQPLQIFNSPEFNNHNDSFSEFIITHIQYEKEILEIRGNYAYLANKIISNYNNYNYEIDYKIMEYDSSFYPSTQQIEYISGDCENYNFTNSNINTIIMSHVFENLYKPRDFLDKINNSNIQKIFISIPDMDNLTLSGDLNNLNILQTFYINTSYLCYLFNLYGFNTIEIKNYNNNSIFYYFKRELNVELPLFQNLQLPIIQKEFYEKNNQTIENININSPFYICPSGFYGQFIYFKLNEDTKRYLLGFLDSDPFKTNKRLSGTELLTFNKNCINISPETVHILISSMNNKNELITELLNYNNNIIFHYI